MQALSSFQEPDNENKIAYRKFKMAFTRCSTTFHRYNKHSPFDI